MQELSIQSALPSLSAQAFSVFPVKQLPLDASSFPSILPPSRLEAFEFFSPGLITLRRAGSLPGSTLDPY